jgi:hypothetical protein
LKDLLPELDTAIQRSGTTIKAEVASKLEQLWVDLRPSVFQVNQTYTRNDVKKLLGLSQRSGGDWDSIRIKRQQTRLFEFV